MKYPFKLTALFLSAAVFLGALTACQPDSAQVQSSAGPGAAESGAPSGLDLADATTITLSGGGAAVDGAGAGEKDGVVTITAAGVYAVSGSLEEGRIIVNAPREDVTVALNGADITCSYGSPLYIYQAGTAAVHLVEGTENTLTDGAVYTYDDEYSSAADGEPNACLYSKADMVIQGGGTLTVTASRGNGITSKDTLQIYNSGIVVNAVGHGINGKDSNTIAGADITVACGGDAIRSTNDADGTLGWVSVSNAALDLTAGEDGIQAETSLTMSGGSCTVTSGGGSGVQPADDASAKGLKAGTELSISSGAYHLDCSDDAIHSNGNVVISGGEYTISTGDDAVHAGETLTVSGGDINVLDSYEGLEGVSVTMTGGTVRITSSDDGVNAAGGVDASGFGGFDGGNPFGGSSDHYIDISGGYLVVAAGGDGLDSNGNAVLSGGTVIVFSSGMGDGALDYDGSFTLSGGTLLAVGSGGMSQTPSQASQYVVSLGFDSTLPAGACVSLAGENQSFVWELPIDAGSIVFSSPELEGGAAYTLSWGGDYSGQSEDGICSGGIYSGGTDLTELTLSDYITTYGTPGMMGAMGGGNMGGRPDGTMGGGPQGGGFPADGEPPENGGMTDGAWDRSRPDDMPPEKDADREPPEDGFSSRAAEE